MLAFLYWIPGLLVASVLASPGVVFFGAVLLSSVGGALVGRSEGWRQGVLTVALMVGGFVFGMVALVVGFVLFG